MTTAYDVARTVTDPELPMLTLEDLGVLRDVAVEGDTVTVAITPTYSGCPAMAAMRDDLVRELTGAGFDRVEVRVSLHPAWTTDWITPEGRAALAAASASTSWVPNISAYNGHSWVRPASRRRRDSAVPCARVRNQRPE